MGCRPPKQQSTKLWNQILRDLQIHHPPHHDGVYFFLKPQAMEVLSPIPCVFWLTYLGHNQCARMPSNQSTDHPCCRTRFGTGRRTCITTKPSKAWCMLLHEEPHAMGVLTPICHALWVHSQGLTSLGYNQYTRILFIHTSEHQSCGTISCENQYKNTKLSS